MKKCFIFFLLVFYPLTFFAQTVTTVRGEVKVGTRQVRVRDVLKSSDRLSFANKGVLVFRNKDGVKIMQGLDGKTGTIAQAVPTTKISIEGFRKGTKDTFFSYSAMRDFFSVSGDKQHPLPFLVIGTINFIVNDKSYLSSPQTPYYLFPEGVTTKAQAILIPQIGQSLSISPTMLLQRGFDVSTPTFFKLVYQNKEGELVWITDCLLVFAPESEVKETLSVMIEAMQGSQDKEIEIACIEALHAAYGGLPDRDLVREFLVKMGLRF
jgi:hypothetical protein